MVVNESFEQALDILKHVPLIDGHNDWPHLIQGFYQNRLDSRFEEQRDLVGHVDIKRLIKGRSGGVFLSAYVGCPKEANDFSEAAHLPILLQTFKQIDLIHRLVDLYPRHLALCQSADEILPVHRDGKVACLIGVEGLQQIANSSSVLRILHKLGVRYITLTHSKNNQYADSSAATPVHGGISPAGRAMIQEMNRIGMLVDLSHTSHDTAVQAIKASLAPVAYTHSSVASLANIPRNVKDECPDLMKANNGIIMVSLIPELTTNDTTEATVDHVIDHIIYIAKRIGFDYIGLGSDFDGMSKTVRGLEDVACFPMLVARMLKRKIGVEDIEKVIGLNIIRVLSEVESVAREQKNFLPILEDEVDFLWAEDMRAFVRSVYPDAEHDIAAPQATQ